MFLHLIILTILIKGALLTGTPLEATGKAIVHPTATTHPAEGQGSQLANAGSYRQLNPYKQYTKLEDLVQNRPSWHRIKTPLYAEAFSAHPDISSIKLDNLDGEGILQATRHMKALRDPNRPAEWQKSLTLSFNKHLEHAKVDDRIKNAMYGYRIHDRIIEKQRRQSAMVRQDPIKVALQKERSKKWHANNKEKSSEIYRQRYAFQKELHALVGSKKLASSFEVANIARASLRSYLLKYKYNQDEINLLSGSYYMQKEKERFRRYNAKRATKTNKTSSTSAAMTEIDRGTSQSVEQDQEKGGKRLSDSATKQSPKRMQQIVSTSDTYPPHYQASSASLHSTDQDMSTSFHGDHSNGASSYSVFAESKRKDDKDVDDLDCGAWWESGCFDD